MRAILKVSRKSADKYSMIFPQQYKNGTKMEVKRRTRRRKKERGEKKRRRHLPAFTRPNQRRFKKTGIYFTRKGNVTSK
jgi:hypothetical protein